MENGILSESESREFGNFLDSFDSSVDVEMRSAGAGAYSQQPPLAVAGEGASIGRRWTSEGIDRSGGYDHPATYTPSSSLGRSLPRFHPPQPHPTTSCSSFLSFTHAERT